MDMDRYWDMTAQVCALIRIGITGFWFDRFTEPYLNGKRKAGATGLAYVAVMFVAYFVPWEMNSIIAYGMGALASLGAMCLCDRRNYAQKLFLAMLMYLLNAITGSLAIIPIDILFEKIIYLPYVLQNLWRQFVCFAAIEIIYVILTFFTMKALVRMINRIYVHKRENMQVRELALMLATPFLALTGYLIFLYFSDIWLGTFGTYIWNVYSQYMWIRALYQMVSYGAILTTIVLYQSIKGSHRREKESAVLDKKEHREAEVYLSGLKEQLNKIEEEMKTGNPVTDVILAEKRKEAQERGIGFICDFHYPEKTGINAFDVSIILNNALDNAMEAAEGCERPFIDIKSWRQRNVYMIEVRNPFIGNLITDRESGLPESAKGGSGHGFGLKNMQKVARKYHGDIDVRQEKNGFVLTVMMMLE